MSQSSQLCMTRQVTTPGIYTPYIPELTMARELIARSFKSGNSVALRLPKALGIEPGEDMVIVPLTNGGLSIWKKSDTRKVFMGLFGSVSPGFMAEGRDDIEQAAYDWQQSGDHTAAA